MLRTGRLGACVVAAVWLACGPLGLARAQTRPAFFDEPSRIEVVGTIRPGERVPLLVLLPPTGGDARYVMPPAAALPPCVLLVTPGVPTWSDFRPSFGRYLAWADERVSADVARAIAEQPVDPERVYLVGFSLGGDVAWGLLNRHPDRYRGAVVMGSRSGASGGTGALTTMHTRHARVAFVIGSEDAPTRRTGIARAHERVRRASIATELFEFPGTHELPPADVYTRALTFVLSPAAGP